MYIPNNKLSHIMFIIDQQVRTKFKTLFNLFWFLGLVLWCIRLNMVHHTLFSLCVIYIHLSNHPNQVLCFLKIQWWDLDICMDHYTCTPHTNVEKGVHIPPHLQHLEDCHHHRQLFKLLCSPLFLIHILLQVSLRL